MKYKIDYLFFLLSFVLCFSLIVVLNVELISKNRNFKLNSKENGIDTGNLNTNREAALLPRSDGAWMIPVKIQGSLQNPAWSPDQSNILFTRFRKGYNMEPADLIVLDIKSDSTRVLVADGSGNVNLPGSSWNSQTHSITFSSSRDPHDEIYMISEQGKPGDEVKLTSRKLKVGYEPSFSPDGKWVVFESHWIDIPIKGIITKYKIDGSEPYYELTGQADDCRQPNWSPAGDLILYQKIENDNWDIWVMNVDGSGKKKITIDSSDDTDASFSLDGKWIVYSSNRGGLELANLFIMQISGGAPEQVTHYGGYDGAPSWSPDGSKIIFESSPGDPEITGRTTLWMINIQNCL
jgi:TolB protein